MPTKKPKYDVPSLKTGFQILEHLSRHPRGQMLTDITAALDCPISSAYRIAMALEDMGLVARDPETKQIRLTTKLLLIGQLAITEANLVEHALDIMRELRDRVQDTVLIGVREGKEVIVLDEAIGTRMFCFISKLGYRIGVSCSAPGKAILAFLPKKERDELIATMKFVRYNERTITSKEHLRRELATVAEKGYSFDDSEQFEGIYCIGAPVLDRSGYPVAAVWTTGLMMNIDRKHIPEIGSVVKSHADRISARLGYSKGSNT
jgi:DNA-binding IclR family transcriptional regulator